MLVEFNKERFASEIKTFRKDKSQKEIGDILLTNRSTVSLLENGKQVPTLDILKKFCEVTGKRIEDFFMQLNDDPVIMMMGKLEEKDKKCLSHVIERINLREKYIAIAKRCEV